MSETLISGKIGLFKNKKTEGKEKHKLCLPSEACNMEQEGAITHPWLVHSRAS